MPKFLAFETPHEAHILVFDVSNAKYLTFDILDENALIHVSNALFLCLLKEHSSHFPLQILFFFFFSFTCYLLLFLFLFLLFLFSLFLYLKLFYVVQIYCYLRYLLNKINYTKTVLVK